MWLWHRLPGQRGTVRWSLERALPVRGFHLPQHQFARRLRAPLTAHTPPVRAGFAQYPSSSRCAGRRGHMPQVSQPLLGPSASHWSRQNRTSCHRPAYAHTQCSGRHPVRRSDSTPRTSRMTMPCLSEPLQAAHWKGRGQRVGNVPMSSACPVRNGSMRSASSARPAHSEATRGRVSWPPAQGRRKIARLQ